MSGRGNFFPDLLLTIPATLLLSLGILVIYSSDSQLAIQQLVFALVGFLLYWVLSSISVDTYSQLTKYLYFGVIFLLFIVFLLGVETRGSVRWIPLGLFNLQPSEFAKPVLILFLANFWSTREPSWRNILKSLGWMAVPVGLVFKQPDLGTSLTIMAIWVIMLIGANVSVVKVLVMSLVTTVTAPLAWFFLKDYQRERIISFLSPTQDPLGIGYNVIQSMIAVGSGEFLGRGLGRGTQSRLQFLPEFRTDFIFASIAEELGFIGSFMVLALYGIIIGRGLKIAAAGCSRFESLVILGVLGMLFFQVTVNAGMNMGILPITGITLPLLSYGGSSLLTTLISLSFIASVARYGKRNNTLSPYLD